MGVLRGTRLAVVGLVGALVAAAIDVGAGLSTPQAVRTVLSSVTATGAVTQVTAVDWVVGAFAGVVVADVLGAATTPSATVGRTLGVLKGALGVAVGLLGVAASDLLRIALAAWPEVAGVVGSALGWELAGFAVGLWVGVVVGDGLDL